MKTYPINLIGLERRRCVVVGGGVVAARKVAGLLEAGAHVVVISPRIVPALQKYLAADRITLLCRAYRPGDLQGAFLVIAATDDPEVNRAVAQEAESRGCLVNVVTEPALSNFIVPAVVRRGELTIAISSGGASPSLARHLRIQLEKTIGKEYAILTELLGELRLAVQGKDEDMRRRRALVQRALSSQILQIIREEGREAARAYLKHLLDEP
ncbi:MAG: bifunctional precorrin-2 dehydrogenase/sirohydrochlorin ferrochelatase [Anaerolineae bacterium]|nr:bifunctional precorrin-2 dehydrogenase/sirohydrochlorin ferrochelatase [Anaerolineae bacterium]MDW8071128.1 bifunctional precorrin-2 dehydrogenase/sirohydrochlorin ferrochelatase [Anaerolineae bacterium]